MWLLRRKLLPGPETKPLYGVNLGGWLLLEKWMTPSLFAGTNAADEYTLSQQAGAGLTKKLQEHRSSFITQADFLWLQLHGIKAVRLPVGYWIFGDEPPYSGSIEYVDKAFQWAEETGIKVLLDLHGAPGSQNGWQESGRIGKVGWHKDRRNIIKSLEIIKKLAERYKGRDALLGIELLNEPHSKIPRRTLLRYYKAAYRIVRAQCGDNTWVVFSDNFKPRKWKRKLRAPAYIGTYIDTHQYQAYTRQDQKLDIAGHVRKVLNKVAAKLAKMQKYHPVIIGEWSLALNQKSLQNFNEQQLAAARRAYASSQLITFERTTAWFYWSYKTEEGGPWSFRDCIEKGLLPSFTEYE